MSRPFERVLEKLDEAQFFLRLLSRSWDDQKSAFYFSAFASAARSVSFTLQSVASELNGFAAWYATHQQALRENPLARFLLEARNETQKLGIAPLAYRGQALERSQGGRHYCLRLYRFVPLERGTAVPEGDAVEACRTHLLALGALVQECYGRFQAELDPGHRYAKRVRALTQIPRLRAPRCPLDRLAATYSRQRGAVRKGRTIVRAG